MKDWYIKEGLIGCILSPFITQVNHVYLSVAYRFHLESGGKSRLRTLCDVSAKFKCAIIYRIRMPFGLYTPDAPRGLTANCDADHGSALVRGTKLVPRATLCQGMIATCLPC